MNLFQRKLGQIKKDPDQFAAYTSNVNTVIKAGPGSGKTTVLTLKIMQLLNEKIKEPRGLACITYSNEAAREFTSRLKEFGYPKNINNFLGTVHSFCISEVVVPFGHLYEEGIKQPIDIITSKEKIKIFESAREYLGFDNRDVTLIDIDKERNQSIGTDSDVEVPQYDIARKVAIEYEKRLKNLGKVDFEEIIKSATILIKKYSYVRDCIEAKFPWILIDEYQDLGKPLHEMVLTLFSHTNIKFFAVGDPDQSIYSFQGSIPNYLLELYGKANVCSITLKTNYRSNQEIINASSMALNIDDREYKAGKRFEEKAEFYFIKCDHNIEAQYKYVIDNIIPECKKNGIPLDEIGVLMKSRDEIKSFKQELDRYDIPCYMPKQDFMKSNVLVWIKDCARWTVDSTAVSFSDLAAFWLNILNSSRVPLTEESALRNKKMLYTLLRRSSHYIDDLKKWVNFVFKELNLKKHVEQSNRYSNEMENIQKFHDETIIDDLFGYDLEKFSLAEVPDNQVAVSTRHSSKGLEFEVVVMLGMEEGNFPHFRSIQDHQKLKEERRLFYVCLTRSKRVCYMLMSNRITSNTKYGRKTHNKIPSRFWSELYEHQNSI